MSSLVTVYITNYNYGRFISEAIDSVLNQSYPNIELIVIDDGSTDNSKGIINQYKEEYGFKVIFQENKGLNATNNVAINHSKGDYIIRLDADDYFDKRAIEELVSKMESEPNIGLVFPDYYYVDTKGEIIAKQVRHDFDNDVHLLDQEAHGACTLIRKEYLQNLGGYDESFTCQDGYELWVKFISNYKVTNLNLPLFYYRQHGNNLTRNEDKILSTRAAINKKNVKSRGIDCSTLAIIPVKDEYSIAFKKISGKSLLELKIEEALRCDNIKEIVISSPIEDLHQIINLPNFSNTPIHFHLRKKEIKILNDHILDILSKDEFKKYSTICTLATEYPFVKSTTIDDAINAKFVFGSSSLISAVGDTSNFYIHEGRGLKSILNREKLTRFEREAVFKQVGGITVFDRIQFEKSKKTIQKPVGHIRVSTTSAYKISSDTTLKWAELIMQSELSAKVL